MTTPNPLHLALSLMQRGEHHQARTLCQTLLERNPKDFNARHLLGVIEMNAGDAEAACATLRSASTLAVADRFRAQALNNLSLALQRCDKLDEALSAIEHALRLLPTENGFHLNKLALLETLQRWQEMLEHAAAHPEIEHEIDAQLMLARAERQLHRPDRALSRLTPLLEQLDEFEPELYGEWALVSYRTHQQAGLSDSLTRLTTEQLQALADYLAEEGEAEGAHWLYQQVLARDPENVFARHMLNAANGQVEAAAPSHYVQGLYDAHAEAFEQRLVNTLGYDAPQRLAKVLASRLPTHLDRVADLGCGSGLLGQALHDTFRIQQLLGCDLSSEMLAQAQQKSVYDHLQQQELSAWLLPQRELQLICATDVLIYTGDLTPVIQQAADALKEGGWFAFTVEQGEAEVSLTPAGRYRHSEAHICAAAEAAGLTVDYSESFPLRSEQDQMITGVMVLLHKHPRDRQQGTQA